MSDMSKVNELLHQAWREALSRGVVISDVEFEFTESMGVGFNLVGARIESKLVDGEVEV